MRFNNTDINSVVFNGTSCNIVNFTQGGVTSEVWRRRHTVTVQSVANANVAVRIYNASGGFIRTGVAGANSIEFGFRVRVTYTAHVGFRINSVSGPSGNGGQWTVTGTATFSAVVIALRASGTVEVVNHTSFYDWSGNFLRELQEVLSWTNFDNVTLPHTFTYLGSMGASVIINRNGTSSSFPVAAWVQSGKGGQSLVTESLRITNLRIS